MYIPFHLHLFSIAYNICIGESSKIRDNINDNIILNKDINMTHIDNIYEIYKQINRINSKIKIN